MDVHVEIAAETLFNIGPIPVTNSMLTMFLVMAALLIYGTVTAKRAKEIPSHSQSLLEVVVEFLMTLVVGTAGRKLGRRVFPLVGAIFTFVIIANYTGLLPGVGTIGFYRTEHEETTTTESEQTEGVVRVFDVAAAGGSITGPISSAEDEEGEKVLIPFFRAPNADLNMTLAMALVTFTIVQIAGIQAHGVMGRFKHMANPPFLFPIEVVSELSRIISLSARLFGNIFAGEVLLGVMYAMAVAIKVAIIPLLFPVVFLFLELLFGAVQALVFALLTLIYITLASEGEHDDLEEHAPAHGATPSTVSHAPAD